jgi:folate-binding Fe-S cluster repair protein YgfZ
VVGVSVSFSKGCYPGQELVERMDSRGSSAPRTLRRLTAPAGVNAGDDIVADGDVVGVYTSVSAADAAALGLVNRSVELGEVVTQPE